MTTSARPAQQLADAFEIVTHNAAQHTHQGAAWRAVRDLLTAPAATFTEPGPNPSYTPPTIDGITLTSDELDQLTAWSRSSQQHGGFRVWLEHDTAVEAATRIVASRLETAIAAMAQQRLVVLPAEHIALTVGLAQVLRGDGPDPNIAAMCVLALARLTGRHDWTDQADVETAVAES